MTTPARFLQIDITRAVKGAKDAGIEVGTVRVSPTGEIVIYAKGEDQALRPNSLPNPLDELLHGPAA